MSAVAAVTTPRSDVASHEAYAERLYERHHRAIFGFCLKQLRRRDDADDAVQMTYIYALLSLRRGIVPQMELPWLLTIARNVCSTRRRSGMRRGAHETPQDLDLFQDTLAAPDRYDVATTEDFTTGLRALPENQRKALLLREWQGLTYDEIGTELGLTQAATEALIFRARQNLARRLDERAGLKTLQGLPFISFLRDLFQTGAAKLLAVGAGAALTMVAVPAARPTSESSLPRPAVPVVQPQHGTQATPQRGDVSAQPAARGNDGAPTNRAQAAPTRRAVHVSPRATESAPPAPSHDVSVAPQQQQPAVKPPVSTPLEQAVDDVGAAVDLPPISLPAVTLPQVQLPEVQLPAVTVQTPSVPPVHLP